MGLPDVVLRRSAAHRSRRARSAIKAFLSEDHRDRTHTGLPKPVIPRVKLAGFPNCRIPSCYKEPCFRVPVALLPSPSTGYPIVNAREWYSEEMDLRYVSSTSHTSGMFASIELNVNKEEKGIIQDRCCHKQNR